MYDHFLSLSDIETLSRTFHTTAVQCVVARSARVGIYTVDSCRPVNEQYLHRVCLTTYRSSQRSKQFTLLTTVLCVELHLHETIADGEGLVK